jgi:hypothetical protein
MLKSYVTELAIPMVAMATSALLPSSAHALMCVPGGNTCWMDGSGDCSNVDGLPGVWCQYDNAYCGS